MSRILVIILLLLHGSIHLFGFLKAFRLSNVDLLSLTISKPWGILWLVTTLLFWVAMLGFILKKDWFTMLVFIALTVSQLLIVVFWKDAKFGTIANVLILLATLPIYGNYQFQELIKKERENLLFKSKSLASTTIELKDIAYLPETVQKWLQYAEVIGKPIPSTIYLTQKGQMKTRPNGKWLPFRAEQYFDGLNPSFLWTTEVDALPKVHMLGRDKLIDGNGEMLIKFLGIIPIVKEGPNEKMNSGALQRYLAEICWFPSAVMNKNIRWEVVSPNAVKAKLVVNDIEVSGIFTFTEEGKMVSFETQRYYGGDEDAKLETWRIKMLEFKKYEGVNIPYKCSVTWKLPEGDFNWLNLEVTSMEHSYN